MLERRRCHPLYIVERVFGYLVPIAAYLLFMYLDAVSGLDGAELPESAALIIAVSAVALVAIVTLFVWIGWRCKWVSAKDNTLLYESGVIFKRRMTIPFSKINTIDMGRNIFQRIFGTCRLKIDTGAISDGTAKTAEMNLVFSLAEAERFRSYILNREAEDEQQLRDSGASPLPAETEPRWAARARFSDFFLYGLTSSSVWKMFLSLIVVISFIGEISSSLLADAGEALLPVAQSAWGFLIANGIIMLIIYLLLIAATLTVISNIISIALAAIRFYGFRVAREGDNVVVRYGLFTVKNYTVLAQNVHAVVVRQNLFQQIIGRCSVEMISIGYGDEKQETALLFPIIEKSKLDWLIGTILPEYTRPAAEHVPGKRSFRFIVLRPLLWSALFFGGAVFGCSFIMDSVVAVSVVLALMWVLILINGLLAYRHNAVGSDEKVMMVRAGGMRMHTHLIRIDAVQSVAMTTGVFQRRHGVASYRIDFHAPVLRSIAATGHLDEGLLSELEKNIH